MKALVTGATGFIGANLVRELLADGDAVRALVRRGSNWQNLTGLDLVGTLGLSKSGGMGTEATHRVLAGPQ